MKLYKLKTILYSFVLMSLVSCSDYFDYNFDDQLTIEETFSKKPSTERFLAGVYGNVPEDMYAYIRSFTHATDEGYFSWESMNYEILSAGSYDPATKGVGNSESWRPNFGLWDHYYTAINHASTFINNVDKCQELSLQDRAIMKAEARTLRAYFYFRLFRQYGPIYVWFDGNPDKSVMAKDIDRHSVQQCVDYMAKELEEAALILPKQVADPTNWAGRLTKGFALGLRSRLMLYAARPLFNGGGETHFGAGLKNKNGDFLFLQSENADLWDSAAVAAKRVIDLGVYELYKNKTETDPLKKAVKSYQGVFLEKWNSELIFARFYNNAESWNQRVVPPRVFGVGLGGYTPDIRLVDAYPMASTGRYPLVVNKNNGYKADGMPEVDVQSGYVADGFTENWVHPLKKGTTTDANVAIKAHNSMLGRDARFYCSVFCNGMYWIHKDAKSPAYKPVTFFKTGTSAFGDNSGDYVKTGFLFTKFTDPTVDTRQNRWGTMVWSYMRLAEIYLNYAEACNEKTDRNEAEALKYINLIRERSNLNNLEEAYPEVLGNKELLRELIYRERMVELAFEDLRYWDLRTWMTADRLNGPRYGLNLQTTTYEDSWQRTSTICRPMGFQRKNYLFPIHQVQLEEMINITQNPGW